MKLVQVFGVVVAVHLLAFVFFFATPGCQASRKTPVRPTPESTATGPGPAPAPMASAPAPEPLSPVDLNPGAYQPAPAPVSEPASITSAGPRYSPTRPGTPAAQAIRTAPVSDVVPARTYVVAGGDSLWKIANANGVTVAELSNANHLTNSNLHVGQHLVIPGKKASSAPESAVAQSSGNPNSYTVRAGDTLGAIARREHTSVATLKSINNLHSDVLHPGQSIELPAPSVTSQAAAGTLPASSTPTPASPADRASGEQLVHAVAPGETLSQIAHRYGVSQTAIGVANGLADLSKLQIGQKLIIPGKGAASAPAKPAHAAPAAATTPPPAVPQQPVPMPAVSPETTPGAGTYPQIAPSGDAPLITPAPETSAPLITPAPENPNP